MRSHFGMNLAITFLLLSVYTVKANDFPAAWDHESVNYPSDPIPFSEVQRCIDTEGTYLVEGIVLSADTIWVSDPDGIIIVDDVSLDHDYVFSLLGFLIDGNNATLEGNNHNIVFDNDDIYFDDSIYGIMSYYYKYNISILNCNVYRSSMGGINPDQNKGIIALASDIEIINCSVIDTLGFTNGISCSEVNSLVQDCYVNIGGDATGISIGKGPSTITDNTVILDGGDYGLRLFRCESNVLVEGNTFSGVENGILMFWAQNVEDAVITGNTFANVSNRDIFAEAFSFNDLTLLDQNVSRYNFVHTLGDLSIVKSGLGEVHLITIYPTYLEESGENLDSDILIQNNSISIDIINQPGFDLPGSIVFHNPTIEGYPPYYPMMNGEPCPDSIFSNFQNSGDTLFSFDVTHMALEFSISGGDYQIEVTDPDSSTIWYKTATPRTISWFYPDGSPKDNVSIKLYRGMELITTLTSSAPNTGSWVFASELPSDWPEGGGYRIFVEDEVGNDGFSNEFMIFSDAIEISEPNASTVWHRQLLIRPVSWDYPGTSPGGNVSIDLYKDYEHVVSLTALTPNNGYWSFCYELPGSWESGDDYRLLIVDDEDDKGWSEEFTILNDGIAISEPNSSTVWYRQADTRTVLWNYYGTSPGGNVSIDLYKGFEQHVTNLTESTDNNGTWSFNFELPGSWESGDDYRLLIVDDEDDQGWSEEFSIDMETGIRETTESDSPFIIPLGPNPCTGQFSMGYYLPVTMDASLGVYDVAGRLISREVHENQVAGNHQYNVDGLPSGVYIFQLEAGSTSVSERFVVLR